jgi:hypothetical protein
LGVVNPKRRHIIIYITDSDFEPGGWDVVLLIRLLILFFFGLHPAWLGLFAIPVLGLAYQRCRR